MTEATVESFRTRLDQLEHENRRLKNIGALLLLVLGALAVMGQAQAVGLRKFWRCSVWCLLIRQASGGPIYDYPQKGMATSRCSMTLGLALSSLPVEYRSTRRRPVVRAFGCEFGTTEIQLRR
jgi:hypothetical protein